MAMSPNCVDTEQIPSKMVAGDREILGIGENPKSFGESRLVPYYAKLGVRDRIHAVRFVQDHAAVYPGPGDQ